MNGEPPAQFDGLYKIAHVLGSVLEFNEPPNLVLPLKKHDHFFRGYAHITTRK